MMFLDMATALRELPDVGGVRDLQLLMPSYRATRVLWELVLETLPQSVLQVCTLRSLCTIRTRSTLSTLSTRSTPSQPTLF